MAFINEPSTLGSGERAVMTVRRMGMSARQYRQAVVTSGGGGGSPAFGAETDRIQTSFTASGTTKVITLTTAIASGNLVSIVAFFDDVSVTATSVADSRGNTYSTPVNGQVGSGQTRVAIAGAPITTGLQVGDTITITFSGTWSFMNCGVSVIRIDNATGSDQTGTNANFDTNLPISLTTTAPSVLIYGVVSNNTGMTVSTVDGTQVGSAFNWVGGGGVIVYKNSVSSGSVTINATMTSSFNLRAAAANFK